jgi:hypothetical protein
LGATSGAHMSASPGRQEQCGPRGMDSLMRNIPEQRWTAYPSSSTTGLYFLFAFLDLLGFANILQILQEISSLYFALAPPRQQQANPFGDMLSSLFGGSVGGGGAPTVRRLAPPAAGLD